MRILWFVAGLLAGVVVETLVIMYLLCLSAVGGAV